MLSGSWAFVPALLTFFSNIYRVFALIYLDVTRPPWQAKSVLYFNGISKWYTAVIYSQMQTHCDLQSDGGGGVGGGGRGFISTSISEAAVRRGIFNHASFVCLLKSLTRCIETYISFMRAFEWNLTGHNAPWNSCVLFGNCSTRCAWVENPYTNHHEGKN